MEPTHMHLRLISLEASICQATSSNIERHSLTEKSRIRIKRMRKLTEKEE